MIFLLSKQEIIEKIDQNLAYIASPIFAGIVMLAIHISAKIFDISGMLATAIEVVIWISAGIMFFAIFDPKDV